MTNQIKCDLAERGRDISKELEREIVLARAADAMARAGVPDEWLRS